MSRFSAGRFGGIAIAVAAGLMLASPALACMPMPPPPMPAAPAGASAADVAALELAWGKSYATSRALEDRAWQVKHQAELFDMSKSLVIVRYDREFKPRDVDYAEPFAVLKPLKWVKGQPEGKAAELKLATSTPPPCGQMRGADALNGKPGNVFVVYLSGSVLRDEDVIEAYAIERIMDPQTLAALTRQ